MAPRDKLERDHEHTSRPSRQCSRLLADYQVANVDLQELHFDALQTSYEQPIPVLHRLKCPGEREVVPGVGKCPKRGMCARGKCRTVAEQLRVVVR